MPARPETVAPVPPATHDAAPLLDRADLLLTLSRAFLPPPAAWSACDWAQPLADDLAELGPALGVDTAGAIDALMAECARWAASARRADGSADPWLVEYTRLFLMPPVRVPLNTGLYLEGSLAGSVAQMMRGCYETAGVLPDEAFRDLPDHVAMQLEFLGRLCERGARGDADAAAMADEFAAEFVHGWAGLLEQACESAAAELPAAAVYRALARVLRAAVADPDLG
jgi:TorA maturation chaperone TorD